jgi:hypothetical protein
VVTLVALATYVNGHLVDMQMYKIDKNSAKNKTRPNVYIGVVKGICFEP